MDTHSVPTIATISRIVTVRRIAGLAPLLGSLLAGAGFAIASLPEVNGRSQDAMWDWPSLPGHGVQRTAVSQLRHHAPA